MTDRFQVRAPIQALVVSVQTELGQAVTAGQTLVVLEAMKMEHIVSAERSGVVVKVLVEAEAMVSAGEPLILLESAGHPEAAAEIEEQVHELFPRSVLGLAARCRIYVADHLDGFLEYVRNLPHYEVQTAEMLPTMGSPLNPTCEVVLVPSAPGSTGV